MGHYHYARSLLEELTDIEDIAVDTYFIRDDETALFPGADKMNPLATNMRDSFAANVLLTLFYHIRFVAYLLSNRPDVVHFNTVFRNQYHTYLLTILAKAAGARVIRTVHEVTADRLRDVSGSERNVAYRHLRACDHLIVHSSKVQADLRSSGVSTPTTVLPHGNYLFFRRHLDSNDDPPLPVDHDPVVLFFGPKQHKGIDVFARALAEVDMSFTTWVAGPVTKDAKSAVAEIESRSDSYVNRGYISDEELPAYFYHADIAVLPYHAGTTSGAVHLARAFKTAVVTSPLPCFTEVVGHKVDGYILSENTPIDLAKALDELIREPDMARNLAVAGLESERSPRFDWARIARETAKLYRDN